MTNMIGMMDMSYDPKLSHAFMAIVVGREENILRLRYGLGSGRIHMSEIIDKARQDEIISKIRSGEKNITAFCIKINRDREITNVDIRRKRIPRKKIRHTYNTILSHSIQENVEKFLTAYGYHFNQIPIECDSDCRSFAKDTGLHPVQATHMHDISDIIAWANKKGIKIPWVVELDRVHETHTSVIERLRR